MKFIVDKLMLRRYNPMVNIYEFEVVMGRFSNLFFKEIKGLFTIQFVLPLIVMFVVFGGLGNIIGDMTKESISSANEVNILDLDNTTYSQNMLLYLEQQGFNVNKKNANTITMEGVDVNNRSKLLEIYDCKTLVVIPKGFTEDITVNHKITAVEQISKVTTTSTLGNISVAGAGGAISVINTYISTELIKNSSNVTDADIAFIENPIYTEGVTVVDKNYEKISIDSVIGYLSTQGVVIPLAVMMLVMFTSQLIISSISTEKIDKTLETLLSTPVSRLSIIWSKMLAATAVAIISAVVYMLGFNSFMGGITDAATSSMVQDITGSTVTMKDALSNLGLALAPLDYVLVGIQMLLTVLISLCCALMLGSLVNDPKSAQIVIMPIMFATLIPYLITIMADINTLPMAIKLIIYAIPFTHTFMAMQNIIFGNWTIYAFGLLYQIVFFGVALTITKGLFTSDKILTVSLNFGQKKKFRTKSKVTEE
ncbi:ABC transporter [Clostridia bacterium]|nr:ABC transporter [Clostridia bacterium]